MNLQIRKSIESDIEVVFKDSRLCDRLSMHPAEIKAAQARGMDALRCYTIVSERGVPLAIMGCSLPDMLGDAHVWAIFTDKARGFGVAVFRAAKALLDMGIKELGISCYFTWNYDNALENDRWMKMLGFKRFGNLDFVENGLTLQGYVYGIR
jgi:hypothetical protein